jgi:hypothetical protein
MNRQTKRLRKLGVSVKFNHGLDFSHQGTKRAPEELTFVEFPFGTQPRKKKGKRGQRGGYTLMELIITLVIIGLIPVVLLGMFVLIHFVAKLW